MDNFAVSSTLGKKSHSILPLILEWIVNLQSVNLTFRQLLINVNSHVNCIEIFMLQMRKN